MWRGDTGQCRHLLALQCASVCGLRQGNRVNPSFEVRQLCAARCRMRDEPIVYFIQAEGGGPIKIGTTTNIRQRLDSLQAGSPVLLRVLGTIPGNHVLERALHQRFATARSHFEWFLPTPALMAFIAAEASTELAPFVGSQPIWRYEVHRETIADSECTARLEDLGREGWTLVSIDWDQRDRWRSAWHCVFWRVQFDRTAIETLLSREPTPAETSVLERWRQWHEQGGRFA